MNWPCGANATTRWLSKAVPRLSAKPSRLFSQQALAATVVLGIVVLATAVRVAASCGDFWLDEIWSLNNTQRISSALEILTWIRHDNNHYLNSWIMYVLGPDQPWIAYRVPAALAGVGSVLVAGAIARRQGRLEMLTAMFVVATSYLLIHYSSEARGYAYVVFFSLLSFHLLRRVLEEDRAGYTLLFAAVTILGVLSHLTFVYCYASLVTWTLWRVCRTRAGWRLLLRCHWAPSLFCIWLYFKNVRGMLIGGGHSEPVANIVIKTLSLSVGGPEIGFGAVAASIVVAAVLASAIVLLWKVGDDAWLFYVSVCLIAPLLALLLTGREDFYVRYFLISATFLLLLLSFVLCRLWRAGKVGRVAYAGLLALMVIGNAVHVQRLLRVGRGGYSDAMRYMLAHSDADEVTVSSDGAERNGRVMAYYQQRVTDLGRLRYVPEDEWPVTGTQWYVKHSHAADYSPEQRLTDPLGHVYELSAEFDYAGLSGWRWFVYRRKDPPND